MIFAGLVDYDKFLEARQRPYLTLDETVHALLTEINGHFRENYRERGITLIVQEAEQAIPAPDLANPPERFVSGGEYQR